MAGYLAAALILGPQSGHLRGRLKAELRLGVVTCALFDVRMLPTPMQPCLGVFSPAALSATTCWASSRRLTRSCLPARECAKQQRGSASLHQQQTSSRQAPSTTHLPAAASNRLACTACLLLSVITGHLCWLARARVHVGCGADSMVC
jgi:hypothetical protein